MEILVYLNNFLITQNIQYWYIGLLDSIHNICIWKEDYNKIKHLNIKNVLFHTLYFKNNKIVSDTIELNISPKKLYPLKFCGIVIPQFYNCKNKFKDMNFIEPLYYSGYLNFLPKFKKNYFHLLNIPKVIHQIWIGGPIPIYKQKYMQSVRDCMKDYSYKLWKNDDISEKNFPYTYKFIQEIFSYMKKTGENRYAQIADLMRYEILYWNGGVYIDTNIECVKNFHKLLKGEFVISSEDPCGLDCMIKSKEKYISNGFIACIPYSKIMFRAIDIKNLDLNLPVNKSTGPFYIRKCIGNNKVTLIKTNYIYPYVIYETKYRSVSKDKCVFDKDGKNRIYIKDNVYIEFPCKKYPKSYLITHFQLGGTWIKK